jgi:hypothetical protein
VKYGAAALAAAALLYVPVLVMLFGTHGPDRGNQSAVVYGLGVLGVVSLVAHVLVTDQPAGKVVSLLVLTGALNALAAVGVFILVLAGGSCSDNGHIPAAAWVGAALLYLAGGTVGLQRAARGIWAVPASVLLAGFWLVALATVLTGSTGACLE